MLNLTHSIITKHVQLLCKSTGKKAIHFTIYSLQWLVDLATMTRGLQESCPTKALFWGPWPTCSGPNSREDGHLNEKWLRRVSCSSDDWRKGRCTLYAGSSMPISNCNTSIMVTIQTTKDMHLKHGLTDEIQSPTCWHCSLSIHNLSCVCLHCLCTDARVFTVERCQHRRPRFGGAVHQTRFGLIRHKTAGHKSLWCRCRDYTWAQCDFGS